MTRPYTYLIGWKDLQKFYYGVRYALNCSPSDLWTTYFTSSKYVKEFRLVHGEPDVIQIRREFTNKIDAKKWEDRVLFRLKVINNDKFLNASNNNSFKNTIMSQEIKDKIGKAARRVHSKGKRRTITNGIKMSTIYETAEMPAGWWFGITEEKRQNQIEAGRLAALNLSEEKKKEKSKKLSDAGRGKVRTPEQRKNISLGLTGIKKPNKRGSNNVSNREDVRKKISDSWKFRIIGIWYTDRTNNFYIKPGDFIDPSWLIGRTTKKSKYYTNGTEIKRFSKNRAPKDWIEITNDTV
jgi:hypothetical protein